MIDDLVESPPPPVARQRWPAWPYKGLNYYEAMDSPLFCERDEEIRECGTILAHFGTKLLILHGRTGTGKSSFIRAGLFPRHLATSPSFSCLTNARGEPLLIRSTADPFARLSEALVERLSDPAELGEMPDADRERLRELLHWPCDTAPCEQAGRLVEVLRDLTSRLPGTLVLAIDQAEEIFTLPGPTEAEPRKEAFFHFLETLCFQNFSVKLILSLRTEYYGQFCDRFRFTPDLNITTVRTGLAQFMLHGIRDRDRLVRAILRPTDETRATGGVTARTHYGFAFAAGLAESIAEDVLAHSGESSTLPILQLVCMDLYTAVKPAVAKAPATGAEAAAPPEDDPPARPAVPFAKIDWETYQSRGKVAGAIDRFIDASIREAVQGVRGAPPSRDEVAGWRDVLSRIVARQEGGALTSLMVEEGELVQRAAGIPRAVECLQAMVHGPKPLLRDVETHDGGETGRSYSLRHDALAPSLFRDDETRRRLEEERLEARRRKRIALVAGALGIVLAAGLLGEFVMSRQARINTAFVYTRFEPEARFKLFRLLEAESQALPWLRPFGVYEHVDDALRDTLARTPVAAFDAALAGMSPDGERIAEVSPMDASIGVYSVREGTLRAVAPAMSVAVPQTGPQLLLAIGFLPGSREVMVYDDGWLKRWDANGRLLRASARQIAPEMYDAQVAPRPDIAAGNVRLTATVDKGTRVLFRVLGFDGATGQFHPLTAAPIALQQAAGSFLPTTSDSTDKIAVVTADAQGNVGTLSVGARSGMADTHALQEVPFLKAPGPGFVASLGFVAGEPDLFLRDSLNGWLLVQDVAQDGDRGRYTRFETPGSQAGTSSRAADGYSLETLDAVRPPWARARPVLAVARHGDGYRLAWIATAGVVVFETQGRTLRMLEGRSPLLPPPGWTTSSSRLQFTNDGDFLTLSLSSPNGVAVRVWDLTDARLKTLRALPPDQFATTVCATLANDPTGLRPQHLVTEGDRSLHADLGSGQPCK
jgi:hypothetical protein